MGDRYEEVGQWPTNDKGQIMIPYSAARESFPVDASGIVHLPSNYVLQHNDDRYTYSRPPVMRKKHLPRDLYDYTVVELRYLAKERGHHGYSRLRKEELVSLLSRKRHY